MKKKLAVEQAEALWRLRNTVKPDSEVLVVPAKFVGDNFPCLAEQLFVLPLIDGLPDMDWTEYADSCASGLMEGVEKGLPFLVRFESIIILLAMTLGKKKPKK